MFLDSFTEQNWYEFESYVERMLNLESSATITRIINWKQLASWVKNHDQNIGPLSNKVIRAAYTTFEEIPLKINGSDQVSEAVFYFRLMKGY